MLKRKVVQLLVGATLVGLVAGCGGINASKSISPLDFILPGLIQVPPQPADPSASPTDSVRAVAQVRP